MPDRLYSGLYQAWDTDNMGNTFAGGLHMGKAPEGTAYPFVELIDLGMSLAFKTSGNAKGQSDFKNHEFQVNIWAKDDGSTDPIVALGTLMRAFDTFVQNNNRTLFTSATEGSIYAVDCLDERLFETEDDEIKQGQLDYRARRVKAVNA